MPHTFFAFLYAYLLPFLLPATAHGGAFWNIVSCRRYTFAAACVVAGQNTRLRRCLGSRHRTVTAHTCTPVHPRTHAAHTDFTCHHLYAACLPPAVTTTCLLLYHKRSFLHLLPATFTATHHSFYRCFACLLPYLPACRVTATATTTHTTACHATNFMIPSMPLPAHLLIYNNTLLLHCHYAGFFCAHLRAHCHHISGSFTMIRSCCTHASPRLCYYILFPPACAYLRRVSGSSPVGSRRFLNLCCAAFNIPRGQTPRFRATAPAARGSATPPRFFCDRCSALLYLGTCRYGLRAACHTTLPPLGS